MHYSGPTDALTLDDPLHPLLRKLLATEDPAEFEELSLQLRTMLHNRIEQLRLEAKQVLKPTAPPKPERRKRKRNGNKP